MDELNSYVSNFFTDENLSKVCQKDGVYKSRNNGIRYYTKDKNVFIPLLYVNEETPKVLINRTKFYKKITSENISENIVFRMGNENYSYKTLLGKGGFGSVCKYTSDSGKNIAVKFFMDKDTYKDELERYLFLKRNDVEDIFIDLYGFIDNEMFGERFTCVIMQMGDSVKDFLKMLNNNNNETYKIKSILTIAETVSRYMVKLLERGIIYSDLKLDNCVLVDGVVKMIDIGSVCYESVPCVFTYVKDKKMARKENGMKNEMQYLVYLLIFDMFSKVYNLNASCINLHYVTEDDNKKTECDNMQQILASAFSRSKYKNIIDKLLNSLHKLYTSSPLKPIDNLVKVHNDITDIIKELNTL